MKRKIIILTMLLLFFNCSNIINSARYLKAVNAYDNQEFDKAIEILKTVKADTGENRKHYEIEMKRFKDGKLLYQKDKNKFFYKEITIDLEDGFSYISLEKLEKINKSSSYYVKSKKLIYLEKNKYHFKYVKSELRSGSTNHALEQFKQMDPNSKYYLEAKELLKKHKVIIK